MNYQSHIMLLGYSVIALAVLLSTPCTTALPQISDATSANPTVFYRWSSDPACISNASTDDCRVAHTAICNAPSLSTSLNVTSGTCTAFYWYDIGNTIPSSDSCYSAYTYINDAGKPGSVGGALGYNKDGKRTMDPLFALYPPDGNANCFKAPGDDSRPKAMNELPNGAKLPLDLCPVATSRRRSNVPTLEKRISKCVIQDMVWQTGCNAVCLSWVTASSWW
ncbi:MAG: hypothetical protein Q9185_006268 [Variospora sp. 1 TL-2023]